ncbi:nucleotidyltransferase domain-containing protein [Rhizobium phaseoli]|uniref:Nucleotidyltransferase domain-containing protein n=1 Tax=Rhizobium phaseoli TaxID=396 RepID=A0ABM6CFK0_9HYPH|nr:nucleotidyltransferase domain-containing protein [Rhizobium phaseoli]ANL87030.1 nucleotidyltransferase domain-containing protein [Rhizobium phaseoli]ANL93539.1 nucleotidyltransferase domain-containing protein [Rhizobium phaseoli]
MGAVVEHLAGRTAARGSFPELAELLRRIEETYAPLDVILYGSRARGEATASSDWDVKVVVSDDTPDSLLDTIIGWRLQEGSGVYADVSVIRLSEFKADLGVANSAVSHLVHDGIVFEELS